MQVTVSRVLTSSVWSNIAIITLDGIVGVKVLKVVHLRVSELLGRFNKGIFCTPARVSALGDIDRTIETVSIFVTFAVVGLELSSNQR
jgi:hypothetical protein